MTRYSNTRYALYFVGFAWRVAALLLLLRLGWSARARDFASRRLSQPALPTVAYLCVIFPLYTLLMLPLRFYAGYLLPHEYGLSSQTTAGFILDVVKSTGLSLGLGCLLAAGLTWAAGRSPRRWWLGAWLGMIPLTVIGAYATPLVVDPLFNRFTRLRDPALEARIQGLAQQAGIERSRVFQMDASRRTKGVNAYVTGIGGAARIVLWDTLLERLPPDETAFVMAHEIGHYVERHVPLGIALGVAGSLLLLLAAHHLSAGLIGRFGSAWKLRRESGLADPAALPVLALVVAGLNFVASPLESGISRTMETRADDFALRLTGDGVAGAHSFAYLAELNLSHPSPPAWIEWWMFSHPPLSRRIERALAWRPNALPRRVTPATEAGRTEGGEARLR